MNHNQSMRSNLNKIKLKIFWKDFKYSKMKRNLKTKMNNN